MNQDCDPSSARQGPGKTRDRDGLRRSLLGLERSDTGLPHTHASIPAMRLPVAERKPPLAESAGSCGCHARNGNPSVPSGTGCCGGAGVADSATTGGQGSCCGGGGTRRFDGLLWGSLLAFGLGLLAHGFSAGLPTWLAVYGHACFELAERAWWGVLAGILAVAVIGRVPRELVAAVLGKSGSFGGLCRAVLAGVALDLCNHGILMVGASLYRRGASLGQTVAFLIASPWNSLSLTLILAALIGWKWMLVFVALSAVVALLTGWVIERLVEREVLPANPNRVDLPADFRIRHSVVDTLRALRPGWGNWWNLIREGFAGSAMVLRWILLGFVMAALVRALVPDSSFQHWFGPTALGLLLTLLATSIIEVCSEGSSPIAADLLTRAQAPGNAFVFLMAGAATDYTEMLVLRQATGSWKAALALPLISTPQVLLIGWLLQC